MEIPTTITCYKCQIEKPIKDYHKDKTQSHGYSYLCKECKRDTVLSRRQKIRATEKPTLLNKKCTHCKNVLPIEKFSKASTNTDGYNNLCKQCYSIKRKQTKDHRNNTNIVIDENIVKRCIKCNIEKPFDSYKINLRSDDKLFSICKECMPVSQWTIEKQRESCRKYAKNHVDKMRMKWKGLNYRLRHNISKRIKDSLIPHNMNKEHKTIKLIGCTILFLKKWLEFNFVAGMNWENYGKWHIDHVKPCKSYNLENIDEQLKCFNWTNLQPLWAIDNIKKSGTVDIDLINNQFEKALQFKEEASAQVKEGELREHPKISTTNSS